jgi:hypothetical protein
MSYLNDKYGAVSRWGGVGDDATDTSGDCPGDQVYAPGQGCVDPSAVQTTSASTQAINQQLQQQAAAQMPSSSSSSSFDFGKAASGLLASFLPGPKAAVQPQAGMSTTTMLLLAGGAVALIAILARRN